MHLKNKRKRLSTAAIKGRPLKTFNKKQMKKKPISPLKLRKPCNVGLVVM